MKWFVDFPLFFPYTIIRSCRHRGPRAMLLLWRRIEELGTRWRALGRACALVWQLCISQTEERNRLRQLGQKPTDAGHQASYLGQAGGNQVMILYGQFISQLKNHPNDHAKKWKWQMAKFFYSVFFHVRHNKQFGLVWFCIFIHHPIQLQ